jgi:hypothetical protein
VGHLATENVTWHPLKNLPNPKFQGKLMKEKLNGQLLGAAGVHYVAAKLNALGLHAAPTIRNVPGVDLFVGTPDGRKSIAIQVKTARWASRPYKAQGEDIKEYQWANKFVEHHAPDFFYAFVNLNDFAEAIDPGTPEVFLVPSSVVARWYNSVKKKKQEWKWARFHPIKTFIQPYKNDFTPLMKALKSTSR